MAKTQETKIIEYRVFDDFFIRRGYRMALEVEIPSQMTPKDKSWGRVDLIGIRGKEICCIEIKISLSDFKSANGHNLFGHYNYYAVSKELIDKIKHIVPEHIGIIVVDTKEKFYDKPVVIKRARRQELDIYTKHMADDRSVFDRLLANVDTARTSTIRRLLEKDINWATSQVNKPVEESEND